MERTEKGYTTGQDALTTDEVRILLSKINDYEDLALFSLAISTGIRREDVVAIELCNVHDTGDVVTISFWEAKKKRTWKVMLSGEAALNMRRHLTAKAKTDRYLFSARKGPDKEKRHISGRQAYNLLQDALERGGLRKRPFHALRSTCMKLCQKRGWTAEQTMRLTGDSWRVVQAHYVTPSDDEMNQTVKEKALL